MSIQVLYNADVLLDGIAGSTEFNRFKLNLNQATKQKTAFGDVARNYLPGIYSATADGDFYYQTGNAGNLTANKLESATGGVTPGPFVPMVLTIGADPIVGNIVNIWKGVNAKIEEGAQHGDVLMAAVAVEAADRSVQATRLIRQPAGGTSGLGAAQNLGALTAAQSLYAALHVLGTTGGAAGTVFSIISSATSSLTAPTTRITFVQGTSQVAGEWQSVAGAITDTWWAAKWAGFAGTSFTISISAGIQ